MSLAPLLRAFPAWADSVRQRLAGLDAAVAVMLCRPTSNRAAYLEIECDARLGRLTFWSAGSANAEVLDSNGGQLWVNDWDLVSQASFDTDFERFLSFFQSQTATTLDRLA